MIIILGVYYIFEPHITMSLRKLSRYSLALYLILISTLSLLPSNDLPNVMLFPNADKLIHCAMYAGLTFLLLTGWPRFFMSNRKLLIVIAIAFWGIVMELLQGTAAIGRSYDLMDELANILGFFPGWFTAYVAGKIWKLK